MTQELRLCPAWEAKNADAPMQFGRDAEHETARRCFVGRLAPLAAKLQVVVHRLAQGLAKFRHRAALKRYHVSDADDLAVKNVVFRIESYAGEVALVFHYGVTPACVRNRRSDSTLPLSVSLHKWGR